MGKNFMIMLEVLLSRIIIAFRFFDLSFHLFPFSFLPKSFPADSSTVKTYMHAGNTITNYANTAESLVGIKVTLHNRDPGQNFTGAQQKFTKAGRCRIISCFQSLAAT